MRNGTRFNKLRLIDSPVGSGGRTESSAPPEGLRRKEASEPWAESHETGQAVVSPILVLFTVSVACATAAIASGSYALWLTRQKATRRTMLDVQEILRVCQERMHQMEDDLNLLPDGMESARL